MSEDTRDRLLHAAGPVFAHKGYKAATVREICQAADVNVASVNYYFGDKEGLYFETVKQAHQLLAHQVPLPDFLPGASLAERLKLFVQTMLARMLGGSSHPWQSQLMMREVLHPSRACRAMVEDYFRPHLDMLLGILDEALPPDLPKHRRYQIAFSVIGQCLYYRVAGDVVTILVGDNERQAHFQLESLAEHITHMTLAALGAIPPIVQAPSPASKETS